MVLLAFSVAIIVLTAMAFPGTQWLLRRRSEIYRRLME
jgi:hypothetical protein